MARRRVKADCRADTRGGRWAGIPVCVITSAAYRRCCVHSRAILVELVARMHGYNNGQIAVSHRELRDALRCSQRKIVRGLAELMEHGLIDVTADGKWKERMAREYRLTFVSTKQAGATNEYRNWTPRTQTGASAVGATQRQSAAAVGAEATATGSAAGADVEADRPETANSRNQSAFGVGALISKPYPDTDKSGWWTADRVLQAHQAILALFAPEPLKAAA